VAEHAFSRRGGHYSCKFLIGGQGCSVEREQNQPTAANGTGVTFMPKVGLDKLFRSASRWQYMLSLDAAVTIHASVSLVNKGVLLPMRQMNNSARLFPCVTGLSCTKSL
jgi:hypothetical protein